VGISIPAGRAEGSSGNESPGAPREGNPERRITTKEQGPRKRHPSIRGETLKVKPSECQRGGTNPQVIEVYIRREVEKTWGRVAQGPESLLSHDVDGGAVRDYKPRKAAAIRAVARCGDTLKPAEVHGRMMVAEQAPVLTMKAFGR
jgi:hypothetical protein